MTLYSDVYERFLSKIEDTNLPLMSEKDQEKMLLGWLRTAISYIELDSVKIKSDFSRNDKEKCFSDDLMESEIEILALYMVVAWYEPIINSLEHTGMFWGSKDDKWDNKKDHHNMTKATQESYRRRARQYYDNYKANHNEYLEKGAKR